MKKILLVSLFLTSIFTNPAISQEADEKTQFVRRCVFEAIADSFFMFGMFKGTAMSSEDKGTVTKALTESIYLKKIKLGEMLHNYCEIKYIAQPTEPWPND